MEMKPARGIAVALLVSVALAAGVAAQELSVELRVADWYPQGNDYVFVCDATGLTPTSYDWWFGDGASLEGVSNNDVYHTFAAPGTYTVGCTAHVDGVSYMDEMTVTVGETPPPGGTSVELSIDEWYPQGNDYVFHCDADGFTPATYDWYFGDGAKLLSSTHDSVYHTYAADGQYTVKCVANSDALTQQDTLHVTVGDATPPPSGEMTLDLAVADWYPQGSDYVFVCEADGWTPTSYDWWFGDGAKLLDRSVNDVYHTYDAAGTYEVMCEASDAERTMTQTLMVTVGDVTPPDGNESDVDAQLQVADWFPQGPNYVFICEDVGFDATHYDFTFGDGEQLSNLTRNNVYHTYEANGVYDPTCTARNGEISAMGSLLVMVDYYNETEPPMNVTPAVEADFTGLSGLIADLQGSFAVSVYNVTGVDDLFRYQLVLRESGTPVENQSFFYPAPGDDIGNSSDWTEIVTDGSGAIVYGPVNGTSVLLEPDLAGLVGVTTPFEAEFAMGDYTLELALVDPDTEAVIVADDPYAFSIVPLS